MPPARGYSERYPHRKEDIEALEKLANRATEDPRIANWFSRRHVETANVLNAIAADRTYLKCLKTDSFREYDESRKEVDELERRVDALFDTGLSTSKGAFVGFAALLIALTILSDADKRPGGSVFVIPCTIFAVSVAVGAGLVFTKRRRAHALSLASFLSIFILLAMSICSVALPSTFSLFPWHPKKVYIDIALSLFAGAMLGRDAMIGIRDISKAFGQACVCVVDARHRKKERERWLDRSLKDVIYPRAVLAINDILGKDSTKLLVEQDSDGLRRLQDPKLIIPTKSEQRLQHLLTRMDGGSIAVTGPRGAGKSTLLRKMCTPRSDSIAPPSIYMSAPSEYVAREFLAELFQQICDAHLQKFNSPIAGMKYRGKRTHRDTVRVIHQAKTVLKITIRMLIGLALLKIATWTPFTHIHFPDIETRLPFAQWYEDVASHVKYFWGRYTILFRVVLAIFALTLLWPGKSIRRRWKSVLRHPESVRQARNYSIHLKIERTTNWGASIGLPSLRGASLSLNKGVSESYAPWSMPELVGKLRDFVEDVSYPRRHYIGPLIIGIDEIDRIGSVEQAERFIGEIKSIFGIQNCFFLVSVAEDVGSLFSRQSIIGQSTLEHSFDDVVVVETLEFGEAREMLSTRVPGFTDAFVFLALALSGGLPREIIRVARRLVDVNHQETEDGNSPMIGDLALRIVTEDIAEVIRTSRSQLSRMYLPEPWGAVLYRLHVAITALLSNKTQDADLIITINNLCLLRPSDEFPEAAKQNEDEAAAAKIVDGIVAFAHYGTTVIEAFDNEFFDLRIAQNSMQEVTRGSYMELAAARMELGISSESSQSIIRNFREDIGLPKLP